jgi:mRNA-degrading endonuclease RelE of RelBE toxin-antitoxin system
MAPYNLEIKASARKDLARLQPATASRIVEATEILADEPYLGLKIIGRSTKSKI